MMFKVWCVLPIVALTLSCDKPVAQCPEDDAAHVYFDAARTPVKDQVALSWLTFPFPADNRRDANGHVDFADFPNPMGVGLLTSFTEAAQDALSGFGLNSAVHLAFTDALDTATLPTDAAAYLEANAPMQLVDITKSSPEYGRVRPLRWQYNDADGLYVAKNSLAVAPTWGFPMRENTTYAFIMTDAVRAKSGALMQPTLLSEALGLKAKHGCKAPSGGAKDAVMQAFLPLRAFITDKGVDAKHIVAATVFTTQEVTAELSKIHDQIEAAPAPAYSDDWQTPRNADQGAWSTSNDYKWTVNPDATVTFYVMEGRYDAPNYQHGNIPYYSKGGGFEFDANGEPVPAATEHLRFVLTIPADAPHDAHTCYPIVEYAHGTGGDAYSFVDDDSAGRMAARGLAGISIDQPLHGLRDLGLSFDTETVTFNFANPVSSRANFRQGAIDTFSLSRFVASSLYVPAAKSPTGEDVCFDTSHLGFFGHSQGGLTGALAAPFETRIQSFMLSGAGGGIAITVLGRTDTPIASLVTTLLQLDGKEPLTEMHPTMTLVQTLVDITDPINYATYWDTNDTYSSAKNILLSSGLHDDETPYRTGTALALAAQIPVTKPVKIEIPEYDYLGMEPATAPVSKNIGGAATSGFMQYINDGVGSDMDSHFLIFSRPEAIHACMRFLETAAYGDAAIIERNPNTRDR